ncbi:RICIN domain-containing protein [Chitinophaga varians]|uniref:RICIN domain-containing protein n=1 Tax=Chitinophaga varians TaxID=2202339 RepID=A0A847RST4_9BACT|nr:RICIN domain-containing protein [Chitinophaga varians]NLR63837.1 RICIN domain-containing protein [Chitinophaga varians]
MKPIMFFLWMTIVTIPVLAQQISGTYAIRNVQTGILLRIRDADTRNGTPIVAYSPVNWKCVTWDFKHVADSTYQLVNLYSGKTLQPASAVTAGTTLEEQPVVAGENNQEYEFIPAGKDHYLVKLKGTNLYLTPADDKGTVNAPIVLAPANNTTLQHWTLKEQHPEM